MPKTTSPHIRHASSNTLRMALASIALSTSFMAYSHETDTPPAPQPPSLSRAEVIADLALWRRAGVDRYAKLLSYGPETEEYRSVYQEYLRLRNSEEFQKEVQKYLNK